MKFKFLAGIIGYFFLSYCWAQDNIKYQLPPIEILELAEAENTPGTYFTEKTDIMLVLQRPGFLTIEEASQPIKGLAGLRINPGNSTSVGGASYEGIAIKDLKTGESSDIEGLPQYLRASNIQFNTDESMFAFLNREIDGVTLWIVDITGAKAKQVGNIKVNDILGTSYVWKNDGKSLITTAIVENRGEEPAVSEVPDGPIVQENLGKAAPSRTYQNLLKNMDDIRLFDYYLTSQLIEVNVDGNFRELGVPAIYRSFSLSPDNSYLLTYTVQQPYSYLVPISSFPYNVDIRSMDGTRIQNIYQAPLAENTPLGFDSTVPGSRGFAWRPDKDAVLYWATALDDGDSKMKVQKRDEIFMLSAPFTGEPKSFYKSKLRYGGIQWSDNGYAVVTERWRSSRKQLSQLLDSKSGEIISTVADRSSEDSYSDPGRFVFTSNRYDRSTLLMDKGKQPIVFTISIGASPEGDRPFLLKWNLLTGETDTLFKSTGEYYEYPVYFRNDGKLIVTRESVVDAPNYHSVILKSREFTPITSFADPYPSLQGVHKEQLSYTRKDGLTLSGTLYLPKGYQRSDDPLPLLMWAYPREFKTANAAGQVKGSPHRFTRISWGSPIYWVNRGFAILDNADMPIVGEGADEPNDTFVEQLRTNAEAAIKHLTDLGYVDPRRVAVGGHSYGAFMTANLLSHTDLFAAGLARSGAYNRTFTPFGFQAEERTYWQAPQVYYQMSPFSYADKIKTPLLLIHGADDENSGTFPIQSERLYNAIKGHGGTTRLVMLPKEFHGYRAKESVLHTLWEMDSWLEKYVKNKE